MRQSNDNKPVPSVIAEVQVTYVPSVRPEKLPVTTDSDESARLAMLGWPDVDHVESIKLMLLNNSNGVMGIKTVFVGGINGSVADIKVILSIALCGHAVSIILLHNHPSGKLRPSSADIEMTMKLKQACKCMDLAFLDHIIVNGSNDHYSFANEGLM